MMDASPLNQAEASIRPYISQQFTKVMGGNRPDMDSNDKYYAVFDALKDSGVFYGLVTKKHILTHPNHNFFGLIAKTPQATIAVDSSIEQAMMTMTQLNTTALPVLDQQQHLVGIITRWNLLPSLYEHQNNLLLKHEQENNHQIAINEMLNKDLTRANAEITRMSDRDLLTDLMNYRLTQDMMDHLIKAPVKKDLFAVVCLAVDNFRWINALYGIPVGDSILKEIAVRVKQTCSDKDILTRQHGDEFIIILPDCSSIARVRQVIKKILHQVTRTFLINQHTISITVSTGVSIYPRDGATTADLLEKANIAMNQAKMMGKNNIQYFTQKMGDRARYENTLREQLHTALERHEFSIAYQPLFDSKSLRIKAIEALLRWNNPILGLVSPVDFIPFIEEMGLISQIGTWVLEEACKQARQWQIKHYPVRVCVNISTRQFQPFQLNGGHQFIKVLQIALKKSGLSPELLELEITESTLMQESTLTFNTLKKIVALGVHLSCDDFGTGYSSFHRLQRVPLNTLKIDKSLVDNIHKKTMDVIIVRAIIHIAKQLNMQTVAEGVEHTEQFNLLRELDCDLIQGFYFKKPMSPDELDVILNQAPH